MFFSERRKKTLKKIILELSKIFKLEKINAT
jgi:hypothetical protein